MAYILPAVSGIVLLLLVLYKFILYPAFLSPLSWIPNAHWTVPFSPLWILWTRYKRRENRTMLAAHERLGEIVRVAPNEISIGGVEGVRKVFGGGFEKGEWYGIFDNYGVACMFSHQHSRPHSITKRWISHVYAKSQLFDSPSLAASARIILSRRLMPIIRASAQPDQKPQGINVHELWFATAMDFITAYQFGLANSSNFLEDRAYRQHWLELYHSRKTYTFFPQELPRLMAVCHKLGIRLVPRWVDWANQEIEAWMKGMVDRGIERWSSNSDYSSQPEAEPVVLSAILNGMEKEGEKEESLLRTTIRDKPVLMIASEMLDHTAAGQETTGITLTYLTWHLSQDLPLQHALRKELLTLDPPLLFPPPSGEDMALPSAKQLDSLPLLHACIMETLRLNAAIPGNTPRVAPFPSTEICGFEVPGGTRVGAAAFTLHRNRGAFDDPLRWDYHRWLDGDRSEEAKKDRDRWFWAFNSGGRMCIGNHFAMNEMKLVIAAVYTNYTTHIVNDDGIEQSDGYTCGPVGSQLTLRFEEAETS